MKPPVVARHPQDSEINAAGRQGFCLVYRQHLLKDERHAGKMRSDDIDNRR